MGSRYVKGISIVNWPLSRLIISKLGTAYARLVTGLPITDCTSGFKCYRAEVLRAIDLPTVRSNGYVFQVETSFRAWRQGFRLADSPIIFREREEGDSKLDLSIALEAFRVVLGLGVGRLFHGGHRVCASGGSAIAPGPPDATALLDGDREGGGIYRAAAQPLVPDHRVLVFSLAGTGDSLQAIPALQALRRAHPHLRLTVLAMRPATAALLAQVPELDEVVPFDFMAAGAFGAWRFLRTLRRRRFGVSLLVYPANRWHYPLVAWLAGARVRVGHRYRRCRLRNAQWLNTRGPEEDEGCSNIEENYRVVEAAFGEVARSGELRLCLPPARLEGGRGWLRERQLEDRLLVAFHPGCDTRKNHAERRWPAGHFAHLGALLAREEGAAILLFGGPEESALKEAIAAQAGAAAYPVDLPDILDAAAVLQCCALLVSNDSGLMHLAGALGVPTVALFGPTRAAWVRNPACPRVEVTMDLACRPCFSYSPRPLACRHGDYRCIRGLPDQHNGPPISASFPAREAPRNVGPRTESPVSWFRCIGKCHRPWDPARRRVLLERGDLRACRVPKNLDAQA